MNLDTAVRNGRLIGHDSFHEVYRSSWKGQAAAIKVTSEALPVSLQAEFLTKISSPRLPRFLDSGRSHQGRSFVVMEYVRGIEIGSARQSLPTLAVCVQLCEALKVLHDHGVCHGDISDRAVRITPWGMRLVDIGIAKETRGRFTRDVRYVAPEIRSGQSAGPEADMYSLGVLVSELDPKDHALLRCVEHMTRKDLAERWSASQVLAHLTGVTADFAPGLHSVLQENVLVQTLAGVLTPAVRQWLSHRLQEEAAETLLNDVHGFLSAIMQRDGGTDPFEVDDLKPALGELEADQRFVQAQTAMSAAALFNHWLDVLVEMVGTEPVELEAHGYPKGLDEELEQERMDTINQLPLSNDEAGDAILDALALSVSESGWSRLRGLLFRRTETGILVKKAPSTPM